MQKAKKPDLPLILPRLLPLFFILSLARNLSAGDIATFTDLGFSENGLFYAFAQYGVLEENLSPWAELYLVDVAANDFVPAGRIKLAYDKKIKPGQDGSGALYQLVSENQALAVKYGINFLTQGIPLFISLENNNCDRGIKEETVKFRDFGRDASYTATLRPVFYGDGADLKSSFHIDLERTNAGKPDRYKVGTPGLRRPKISSYTIKKALVTEDRKSIIFVIEMTYPAPSGAAPCLRYMVEACRFKD